MIVDDNNNYIVIGNKGSTTSTEPRKPWIVKMDSNFNIIASKTIGVYGTTNILSDVKIDNDNNIVAVGRYSSAGIGSSEILIAKFDPNLNLIDTLLIGGTNYDFSENFDIDADNNIIIVGSSRSAKTNTTYSGLFAANIKGDLSALNGTATETLGYQITKPELVSENVIVSVTAITESSVFQEGASSTATIEVYERTLIEKTALY
jgi:hypothetical protein